MSPSSREREREYARRRYEKWAAKQAQRELERRKARRNAIVAGGTVVAVLAIVLGAVALTGRSGSTSPAAAPSASPSASAASAANPCPAPTVKPPAKPATFKDVPPKSLAQGKKWKLTLVTSCGTITMTLDGAKAPQATASAIFLARQKFWAGTPCHRVTTEGIYVLQCGDPTGSGSGGPGYSFGPVENAPRTASTRRHPRDGPGQLAEQQRQPVLHRVQAVEPADGRRRLHRLREGHLRAWTSSRRSRPAGRSPPATGSPSGPSRSCRRP